MLSRKDALLILNNKSRNAIFRAAFGSEAGMKANMVERTFGWLLVLLRNRAS